MCQIDTGKRVKFDELANWINVYKDKILAKQNFQIANCPQNFHNEVMDLRMKGHGTDVKMCVYPPEMMKVEKP